MIVIGLSWPLMAFQSLHRNVLRVLQVAKTASIAMFTASLCREVYARRALLGCLSLRPWEAERPRTAPFSIQDVDSCRIHVLV